MGRQMTRNLTRQAEASKLERRDQTQFQYMIAGNNVATSRKKAEHLKPAAKTKGPTRGSRKYRTSGERIRAGEPTATDEVVAAIKKWVMAGHVEPGQRLTESELSEQLGVSKGPIREAVQRLVAEGVVEFAPYQGIRVRQLSETEIENLFDLLELIEGLAARKAAENIRNGASGQKLKDARSSFDSARYEEARTDWDGNEDNLRVAIYELANNALVKQLVGRLQFSIIPVQLRSFQRNGIPVHLLGLVRSFVDAILAGDARGAELAAKAHMRALRDYILDYLAPGEP
jgi:DNA-binding GntR family transcriptional regulator